MDDDTNAQTPSTAEFLKTTESSGGTLDVEVIDIAGSLDASAMDARSAEVARALVASFRDTGFAVITGHGVAQSLFDEFCATSLEFFRLPLEEKMKVGFPSPEVIRGYEPVPDLSGNSRRTNAMESLLINRLDTVGDYDEGTPEARLWRWPNLWPEDPTDLRPVWEQYYREMERVGNKLLELVAIGLHLPKDWFENKIDRHYNNLASNFYPPRRENLDDSRIPIRAHTDHGALTLLYRPNEPGGLEVFAQHEWWNVPFIEGSLVLNVGDVLSRWTGGLLPATPHRVVWAVGSAGRLGRQSVAYFQQPNPDASLAVAGGLSSGELEAEPLDVPVGVHISRRELGATFDALGI
jgi:isopenicillin N synthase-like dioxygenase